MEKVVLLDFGCMHGPSQPNFEQNMEMDDELGRWLDGR